MTTTQKASNGHGVLPPPFPAEDPAPATGADLPTDKANNNELAAGDEVVERQKGVPITPLLAHEKVAPEQPPFPATAYHVPPKLFAPKADSFRNTIPEGWGRTKLPERCQFMFSDGRQCTMARSDIHPSLCVYHSDREEQLFGDPGERCEAKTLDFPELHSACRDLSTASGVNRALAQVFRMLARGRISRQEAATFAKLGHLLLQSISAARTEVPDPIRSGFRTPVELRSPSFGGTHQESLKCRDFFRLPGNAEPGSTGLPTPEILHCEAPPAQPSEIPPAPLSDSGLAARITERTPRTSQSAADIAEPPRPMSLPGAVPFAACAPAEDTCCAAHHPQNQHLREFASNPSEISTCKFPPLETFQNQHLHKTEEAYNYRSGGSPRLSKGL